MYQLFSRWAIDGWLNEPGWPDRQRGDARDPVGRERREHPRERRAPVVADDVHAIDVRVASTMPSRSPNSSASEYWSTPSGLSEAPKPRRSGAIVRYPAACSAAIWSRHIACVSGQPWTRSTGVAGARAGVLIVDFEADAVHVESHVSPRSGSRGELRCQPAKSGMTVLREFGDASSALARPPADEVADADVPVLLDRAPHFVERLRQRQ